jgi:hypothetical protein
VNAVAIDRPNGVTRRSSRRDMVSITVRQYSWPGTSIVPGHDVAERFAEDRFSKPEPFLRNLNVIVEGQIARGKSTFVKTLDRTKPAKPG